jgi:glutaredoxin
MVESVTLFYNQSCSSCLQARDTLADLMAEKKIPFVAREVTTDVHNRDQLILSSGQVGAPVVLVNKREVVGLNRARLQRLLGVDVGQEHPAHW